MKIRITVAFFLVLNCALAQTNVTVDSFFAWNKNRSLKYDDYKLHFGIDTNGYRAIYKGKNGREVDTILPRKMNGSQFSYPIYAQYNHSYAHSTLSMHPHTHIKGKVFTYSMVVEFYSYESYIHVRTRDMLMHEQNHFDIAELYARKIRKYFATLVKSEKDAENDKIDSITQHFYMQMYGVNEQMDNDAAVDFSENGNLERSSLIWKSRIEKQLDSLKKYVKISGKVILK